MTEAKKYASKRVSSTDYPVYNDEYELELAFEEGAKWADKILVNKVIKWFEDNFVCLPPDFESMFREAMKKPSYEQNN